MCRAGSQCQGDTRDRDQSQLLSLRAFPSCQPPPATGLGRAPLPAGHGFPGERQGRAPHTSQPQQSSYFLRKSGTKGTKAGIPAVPTGRDKNSVSTTLFSIRGDASTQNTESSLELKPFVSPSLIAGTFLNQLHSSCCKIDFYKSSLIRNFHH